MAQSGAAYWHFHCPECGFGNAELARLAGDEDIYGEVCLEEDGRRALLHRWMELDADHARLRGDLAA